MEREDDTNPNDEIDYDEELEGNESDDEAYLESNQEPLERIYEKLLVPGETPEGETPEEETTTKKLPLCNKNCGVNCIKGTCKELMDQCPRCGQKIPGTVRLSNETQRSSVGFLKFYESGAGKVDGRKSRSSVDEANRADQVDRIDTVDRDRDSFSIQTIKAPAKCDDDACSEMLTGQPEKSEKPEKPEKTIKTSNFVHGEETLKPSDFVHGVEKLKTSEFVLGLLPLSCTQQSFQQTNSMTISSERFQQTNSMLMSSERFYDCQASKSNSAYNIVESKSTDKSSKFNLNVQELKTELEKLRGRANELISKFQKEKELEQLRGRANKLISNIDKDKRKEKANGEHVIKSQNYARNDDRILNMANCYVPILLSKNARNRFNSSNLEN